MKKEEKIDKMYEIMYLEIKSEISQISERFNP